jgi:aquaporin Z
MSSNSVNGSFHQSDARMTRAVAAGAPPLGKKVLRVAAPLVQEFVGTFFLTLAVTLSHGNPLTPGFTLVALVFMAGHVSGAQFNPAVTLGILLSGRKKITPVESVEYVLVQLVGGVLGGLFGHLITGGTGGTPDLGKGVTWWEGFLAELAFTALLVFVILNVATTKSQDGNSFFGLLIRSCRCISSLLLCDLVFCRFCLLF